MRQCGITTKLILTSKQSYTRHKQITKLIR